MQYFATSWGLASKGQLGVAGTPTKTLNALRITALDAKENFLEVGCGENHTLMLTDQLSLVTCGSNTYGQLGSGLIEKPAQKAL